MNQSSMTRASLLALAGFYLLTGIQQNASAGEKTQTRHPAATHKSAIKGAAYFIPPQEIPHDEFGKQVRQGEQIFLDTPTFAKGYAGNGLSCANCHLDRGRRANSAPMWAAYVAYPAYRSKNKHVNTFQERLQGCFKFSMNGKSPAADSEVMNALVTYAYWMAKGAPTGDSKMAGRGYLKLAKPPLEASAERGARVYAANCAVCHGMQGEGQKVNGKYVFPPLWGADSFNWGAGMHRVDVAAGFIKANMPLGKDGSLTDQDVWDVTSYMDSQPRPQDPRFKGNVSETRQHFHNENCHYGETGALQASR